MPVSYLESQKHNELCSYLGKAKTSKRKGDKKMVYNTQNAKEIEGIPAGVSAEGVIVNIKDGKSRDFVQGEEAKGKWKGDLDQPAIEVEAEVKYNNSVFKLSRMFTYNQAAIGIEYATKSNLGKYKAYYKKLPEVGDKVNLLSNKDGFFRLLIE